MCKPPCRAISPNRWTLFVCLFFNRKGLKKRYLWPAAASGVTGQHSLMRIQILCTSYLIMEYFYITNGKCDTNDISMTSETFTTCGSTGETHNRQVIWGWWLWRKKQHNTVRWHAGCHEINFYLLQLPQQQAEPMHVSLENKHFHMLILFCLGGGLFCLCAPGDCPQGGFVARHPALYGICFACSTQLCPHSL